MFLWVLVEVLLAFSTSVSLTGHTQNVCGNIYRKYVPIYAWFSPGLKGRLWPKLCGCLHVYTCVCVTCPTPGLFSDWSGGWIWTPVPKEKPQTRKIELRNKRYYFFLSSGCTTRYSLIHQVSRNRQITTSQNSCLGIYLDCGNMLKSQFQWILNYLSGVEHL